MTMYVATETFFVTIDGAEVRVLRGKTLVDEDTELYRRYPDKFKPAEAHFRAPVEAATAAPGEKRGAKSAA
jgi:hypothetical protein